MDHARVADPASSLPEILGGRQLIDGMIVHGIPPVIVLGQSLRRKKRRRPGPGARGEARKREEWRWGGKARCRCGERAVPWDGWQFSLTGPLRAFGL